MQNIIFIPGLGADERLFSFIKLENCNVQFVKWEKPEFNDSQLSYLQKIIMQLNVSVESVLIGVSLGGMIAMELRELMPVKKTIIISSVKMKMEFPPYFNWLKKLKVNEKISPALLKKGATLIRPLITDMSNSKAKKLFTGMIHDCYNDFISWAIRQVLKWNRTSFDDRNLIHIHGTKDHVFPLRNISQYDYESQMKNYFRIEKQATD